MRGRNAIRLGAVCLVLIGAWSHRSDAQLSPGDLAEAHAGLEGMKNCTQCHELGKQVTDRKCLACHREIAARREPDGGFHATVRDTACAACHSDHNGRGFQMVHWPEPGPEAFDHERTGYSLQGRHREIGCRDCHRADRVRDAEVLELRAAGLDHTFLGLDRACSACHDDAHRGQLGDDCSACHELDRWQPAAGFRHDRARFPLAGKHADLACDRCHPSLRATATKTEADLAVKPVVTYRPVPFEGCVPCHKDVHAGRLGQTCDRCHSQEEWHRTRSDSLDHARTRYPLEGRHATASCEACHGSKATWRLPSFDTCRACHADAHTGQLDHRADSGACESCHTTAGFSPAAFGQLEHTSARFPLEDAHQAVPCVLCHTRAEAGVRLHWETEAFDCATCHESPHRGQFPERIRREGCEGCHVQEAWRRTTVDHQLTRFPLQGRHRAVACGRCHTPSGSGPGAYAVYQLTDTRCEACHRDPHAGQFAQRAETECEQCHTADDWLPRKFDHAATRFALTGAHQNVDCLRCHPASRQPSGESVRHYRPLDPACEACHAAGK